MVNKIHKYLLFAVIIAITVYFVFFFKTELTHYRIFQELWNSGHIFLFIGINYFFYKKVLNHLKISLFSEFFIIISGSFILGFCIEILQSYTGRDKSIYDVLLDIVGAMIAFILFSKLFINSGKKIQLLFSSFVITFTVISLFPMYTNIADAINQRIEFPILLMNGSTREVTRFKKNNAELTIDKFNILENQKKFLQVTFNPAKYSVISLESFDEAWSPYNFLVAPIYNPKQTASVVILRIHDRVHELNGFNLNDRFNTKLILKPGWNTIKISLSEVKGASLNREMDLNKVTGLMFFKMNLEVTEILFFSQIQLLK